MVGLLAMSFALPAVAATRPANAINPDGVTGWWLYDEGGVGEEWTWVTYTMTTWYQIWINNETPQATPAEAWLNATAGMVLLIMDFGIDLTEYCEGPICIHIWDAIALLLVPGGATEKAVEGLDHCYLWEDTSIWAALGNNGQYLIMAVGWGSETPPGNPFELAIAAKGAGPSDTGANDTDIMDLMMAQGSEFGGGIPGFTMLPLFISLAVILGLVIMLRKEQINLL